MVAVVAAADQAAIVHFQAPVAAEVEHHSGAEHPSVTVEAIQRGAVERQLAEVGILQGGHTAAAEIMLVFHPQLRRPRAPPCNPPYFDAQAGVAGGGIDILAAIAQREQIAALFGITVQRALRGIQARIWRELPVAAGQVGAEGQRTEPLAAVAACMREAAICGHVATQGVVQQLVADQRIHEQAAAQAVARIQRHAVGLAIAAAATLANIAAIASILLPTLMKLVTILVKK
ncbi:hypothetical protein G6F35_014902 [Rhizopus arrhizus]|nr:hypothetical protein G6F35_014902 [Rhizopus arrhizus]